MAPRLERATRVPPPLPEPGTLRPMLAVAGPLPEGDPWCYELKWDGVRALAIVERRGIRLVGRSGRELTATYPSLVEGGRRPAEPLVVDGEIVALDERGRPSFQALQGAGRRAGSGAPRLAYVVFDVLRVGDRSLLPAGYAERRAVLSRLDLDVPGWSVPEAFGPPGADVLAASDEAGLEGVVAKRRDSPYLPGRRSSAWVKVKHLRAQEVVVGGYTRGEGRRSTRFGSLLLGVPGSAGLDYVGNVGTGFDEAALADLGSRLAELEVDRSPFSGPVPGARAKGVRYVRPLLVGEVRFSEWTSGGRLRQPSWRGLREDKEPDEVRREP